MQISDALQQYILSTEGFSATAYKDGTDAGGNQLYSIGYGHQIQPYEAYLLTATISTADAVNLFLSDIAPIETDVNAASGLNQNQFDALCDFGYNCGEGALQKVLANWESSSDPTAVCAEISLYTHSSGNVNPDLVARRAYEVNLFNTAQAADGSSAAGSTVSLSPGDVITLALGAVAITIAVKALA